MKLASISVLRLFACAAFLMSVLSARAADADPTGTWTWTQQGRQGGEPREVTLTIKKDGDKYTGTLVSPGRQGSTNETKIDNVKVAGEEISFNVTRTFQDNTFTSKYSGKISGDTITGKIELERDGQTRSRDWTAKRKKS